MEGILTQYKIREVFSLKQAKITVLKTTLDEELAREYGAEGLTACPMLRRGQIFYADYAKARRPLRRGLEGDLSVCLCMAHGAEKELFYYGDWIRTPGVAICSCNDGLRPVIFKLEATDRESVPCPRRRLQSALITSVCPRRRFLAAWGLLCSLACV